MEEPQKQEKSLEEAFEELDALAERLEEKGISLDESFRLYKQGMDLQIGRAHV